MGSSEGVSKLAPATCGCAGERISCCRRRDVLSAIWCNDFSVAARRSPESAAAACRTGSAASAKASTNDATMLCRRDRIDNVFRPTTMGTHSTTPRPASHLDPLDHMIPLIFWIF